MGVLNFIEIQPNGSCFLVSFTKATTKKRRMREDIFVVKTMTKIHTRWLLAAPRPFRFPNRRRP
jgi:hypothetical protein